VIPPLVLIRKICSVANAFPANRIPRCNWTEYGRYLLIQYISVPGVEALHRGGVDISIVSSPHRSTRTSPCYLYWLSTLPVSVE
jgi:hypothetical protein